MVALLKDAPIHNRLHPFSVGLQRRLLRQQPLELATDWKSEKMRIIVKK